MQDDRTALRQFEELHCYFPEWADRPAADGWPAELDRNSYLAGGYSEELGHLAQPARMRAGSRLTDEPEHSSEWRVQIGCLHPGYPECPRPSDRDRSQSEGRAERARSVDGAAADVRREQQGHSRDSRSPLTADRVGAIPVRDGRAAMSRKAGAHARLASIWTRVRALGAYWHSGIAGIPVPLDRSATRTVPSRSAAQDSRRGD